MSNARVVAWLEPFGEKRIDVPIAPGQSIRTMLDSIGATRPELGYAVQVRGVPVPASEWDRREIGAGDLVAVRAVPTGRDNQGKDLLRVVGTLALLAWNPLAGLMSVAKNSLLYEVIRWGSAFMWERLTARGRHANPETPRLQWTWQNAAAPYLPFPKLYGRLRVYPPYGARPYQHTMGDESKIYALYAVGVGPIEITSIRFGTTEIDDIEDIEYEVVTGSDSDHTRTITPPVVHTQEFTAGQFSLPPSSAPTWRIETDEYTSRASLNFVFPNGLGALVDSDATFQHPETGMTLPHPARGRWLTVRADIKTEARRLPGVFQQIYAVDHGTTRIKPRAHQGRYYSKTYFYDLGGHFGQDEPQDYEFKLTRYADDILQPRWTTPDGTVAPALTADQYTVYSDCEIMGLDSLEWTDPINEERIDPTGATHIATIGVRIDASKAENIQWDSLSCVGEAYVNDWNGASWAVRLTDNPAAAYRDVYQGAGSRRSQAGFANPYIGDARLDLDSIQAWAEYCTLKGYSFSHYFTDQVPVRDALDTICAVGFARRVMIEGKFGVSYDYDRLEAGTAVTQLFTPRNSWDFGATRALPDALHGIRGRYLRRGTDDSYRDTERVAFRDGYAWNSATNVIARDIAGVTDETHLDWLLWYHIKESSLRSELWQLKTDIEHLVCRVGDLVTVAHDVPLIGNKQGRITAVTIVAGAVTHVTLNEEVYIDDTDYLLRVRSANVTASPWYQVYRTPYLVNANDWVTEVEFVTPIAAPTATTGQPEVGDLFVFGKEDTSGNVEQFYLLAGINPHPDLSATLLLVEEAAGREGGSSIYAAGAAASYQPDVNEQPWPEVLDPPPLRIINVATDETVLELGQDGSYHERIVLTVSRALGAYAPVAWIEVQYRVHPSDGYGFATWNQGENHAGYATEISVRGVETLISYDVRVRTRSLNGRASAWELEEDILVIGRSTPPPDPENLVPENEYLLRWGYGAPPLDLAGFEVRRHAGANAGWDRAQPVFGMLITGTCVAVSPSLDGEYTYYVKAVDTAGNYSTNAASLTATWYAIEEVPNIEAAAKYDWQNAGWPGTITNGTRIGGEIRQIDEDEPMIYVSGWWWDGAVLAYGNAPVILAPTLEVTADSWWLEYQTDMNVAGDIWIPWPGRVRVYPYAVGATPRVSIRFRITVGPGTSQGRISELNIRRGFPMMREVFDYTFQMGGGYVQLRRPFSHISQVTGSVKEFTEGDYAATHAIARGWGYSATYTEAWVGIELLDANGNDATGVGRFVVEGYRCYGGPSEYNEPSYNPAPYW